MCTYISVPHTDYNRKSYKLILVGSDFFGKWGMDVLLTCLRPCSPPPGPARRGHSWGSSLPDWPRARGAAPHSLSTSPNGHFVAALGTPMPDYEGIGVWIPQVACLSKHTSVQTQNPQSVRTGCATTRTWRAGGRQSTKDTLRKPGTGSLQRPKILPLCHLPQHSFTRYQPSGSPNSKRQKQFLKSSGSERVWQGEGRGEEGLPAPGGDRPWSRGPGAGC